MVEAEEIITDVFRAKERRRRGKKYTGIPIRDKYEAESIIEGYFNELGIKYSRVMESQTRRQILLDYDFFIDPAGPHGSIMELNFTYDGGYHLESCVGMIVMRKITGGVAECPMFTLSKNIKIRYTHFHTGVGEFCYYHFSGGGVHGPAPSIKEIKQMLNACKREYNKRKR